MLPAIVLALVHVLCDAFASTRTTLEWLLCVFLGSNYVMSPARLRVASEWTTLH